MSEAIIYSKYFSMKDKNLNTGICIRYMIAIKTNILNPIKPLVINATSKKSKRYAKRAVPIKNKNTKKKNKEKFLNATDPVFLDVI